MARSYSGGDGPFVFIVLGEAPEGAVAGEGGIGNDDFAVVGVYEDAVGIADTGEVCSGEVDGFDLGACTVYLVEAGIIASVHFLVIANGIEDAVAGGYLVGMDAGNYL